MGSKLLVLVTVCEVSLAKVAIGFALSSVLYLAPDFGTWKMNNSFNWQVVQRIF